MLNAFDALPPADQREVVAEILRRAPAVEGLAGEGVEACPGSVDHGRPLIRLPEGTELISETLINERR